MPNHWLLTWTTYGTWLPGDARGFVSGIRVEDGQRHNYNQPHEPYSADIPALEKYSRGQMKNAMVLLTASQAKLLLAQFIETARYQNFELHAAAIMANHIHLVCSAPIECKPSTLLKYFKSYGSRCLNSSDGNRRWWTVSGSARLLPDTKALENAIQYVLHQHKPFLVWLNERSM